MAKIIHCSHCPHIHGCPEGCDWLKRQGELLAISAPAGTWICLRCGSEHAPATLACFCLHSDGDDEGEGPSAPAADHDGHSPFSC